VQRFFNNITDIHQFTCSLRWNQTQLQCPHCHQHDQWVSHGFIYKQLSFDQREPVGKRILCSNRFGNNGCGRTHRFYCAHRTPYLHYSLSVCISFLIALVLDQLHCVCSAYRHATGASDTRQAWRWLNKLKARLGAFRTFLLPLPEIPPDSSAHCASPLMSTLHDLLTRFDRATGTHFQSCTQTPFI